MVREFERKLRLTAAMIGANTRKDLARAFHRVNRATTFDIDRAAKWLQGRAHPRDLSLYEDWAAILQLDRPLAWLLECELPVFLSELSQRHGIDPLLLARRADRFGRPRPAREGTLPPAGAFLCGSFACYRHAFSPYFRGRLIRSSLIVSPASRGRLQARYSELLPTGPDHAVGPVSADGRSLFIDLASPTVVGDRAFLSLFKPQPPASCLAGLYCSATLISPNSEPSCSRLLAVRTSHLDAAELENGNRYMEPGESIAADLARHGVGNGIDHQLDAALAGFLSAPRVAAVEQVEATSFAALAGHFDRAWIASRPHAEASAASA